MKTKNKRVTIDDLRRDRRIQERAERNLKDLKLFEAESDDSDDESSVIVREVDGHRPRLSETPKWVRSGIIEKPTDKVRIRLNWPQAELKYDLSGSGRILEFNELNFTQFLAGELEIITRKIS